MKRSWLVGLALGVVGTASAAILPNNVIVNPTVEDPQDGNLLPVGWFYGSSVQWSTAQSTSPTHSLLAIGDASSTAGAWRSNGVALTPAVTDVEWSVDLYWENILTGPSSSPGVFIAFFDGLPDSFGNTTGGFLGQAFVPVSEGTNGAFETFTQTTPVPAGAQSFDIRPRLWFTVGNLYADDISARLIPEPTTGVLLVLAGVALLRRR